MAELNSEVIHSRRGAHSERALPNVSPGCIGASAEGGGRADRWSSVGVRRRCRGDDGKGWFGLGINQGRDGFLGLSRFRSGYFRPGGNGGLRWHGLGAVERPATE